MADLTPAQRQALAALAQRRPIAGNDDGWVSDHGIRYPTLCALVRAGMVETDKPSYYGPRGQCCYRVTEAGRAALTDPTQGETG